ncbi:MAG: hypothetical protein ABIP93_20430 [Gemmatimonadaceae bacterium]
MHVALHFPLADVRQYAPDAQAATWPLKGREFVRGFGRARARSERPWADRYPAESTYCDAKRVLRFEPLLRRHVLGSGANLIEPFCAHRRLLGDGLGAMRLEVGIGTYARSSPRNLNGDDLLAMLAHVLELRVRVHTAEGPKSMELVRADLSIARSYLAATTPKGAPPPPKWWVSPGRELCVVMYDPDSEVASLPRGAKALAPIMVPVAAPGANGSAAVPSAASGMTAVAAAPAPQSSLRMEIAHLIVEHRGVSVRVLFLAVPRAARHATSEQRHVRLHLARVHTERECLKEVLRLIDLERLIVDPTVPGGKRLGDYLRAVFSRLNRPSYEGLPQESLARAMEDGYDAITEEQRDRIMSRLELARPAVVRDTGAALATNGGITNNIFTEHFNMSNGGIIGGSNNQIVTLGAGASVHGPVVNGAISDSFNTIEKSGASPELKAELTNLTKIVAEMAEKLDKEKATDVTRDLKALTDAATAPTPRRKWYELSSAGLLEAASFAGEFAARLTGSLASVTKLLGF